MLTSLQTCRVQQAMSSYPCYSRCSGLSSLLNKHYMLIFGHPWFSLHTVSSPGGGDRPLLTRYAAHGCFHLIASNPAGLIDLVLEPIDGLNSAASPTQLTLPARYTSHSRAQSKIKLSAPDKVLQTAKQKTQKNNAHLCPFPFVRCKVRFCVVALSPVFLADRHILYSSAKLHSMWGSWLQGCLGFRVAEGILYSCLAKTYRISVLLALSLSSSHLKREQAVYYTYAHIV